MITEVNEKEYESLDHSVPMLAVQDAGLCPQGHQ
jgi:hypothetical protein